MVVIIVLLVLLLAGALSLLIILLVSKHNEKVRRITESVVLTDGKSVSTELIQGRGLLNDHMENDVTTVISGALPVTRYHGLLLTDYDSGRLYQQYFSSEILLGNSIEDGRVRMLMCEKGVSRTHCRIYFRKGIYYLEDCASTNHTWLNGSMVNEPVQIASGDKIQLASKTFQVTIWTEG